MAKFEVLDQAHRALRDVTAGLADDDLRRPTPCAQWDVAQVLQHAAGDQRAYAHAILGQDGPTADPFAPDGTLGSAPLELVEPALAASARAFATIEAAGNAPTPLPGGDLPAQVAAGAAALDAAVHAWDVAVATGQRSPLDDELADVLLPVAHAIVEPLRQYGAYAAALPTADGDGPSDVLLRYLGRNPRWS